MLRAGLQTPRGRSQLWAGPPDLAGRPADREISRLSRRPLRLCSHLCQIELLSSTVETLSKPNNHLLKSHSDDQMIHTCIIWIHFQISSHTQSSIFTDSSTEGTFSQQPKNQIINNIQFGLSKNKQSNWKNCNSPLLLIHHNFVIDIFFGFALQTLF